MKLWILLLILFSSITLNFRSKNPTLRNCFYLLQLRLIFRFNGNFYDQVDGVAMGSPLAPIIANLFLGFHEETWLNNSNHSTRLLYRRYVDDTFCVFHNEQDAMSFFDFINSRHPNIKFTFEKEKDGKLCTATRLLYSVVKSKNTQFLPKQTLVIVCWAVWWADRFLVWWTALHRNASSIIRPKCFAQTVIMANDVNTRVQVSSQHPRWWHPYCWNRCWMFWHKSEL